MKTCFVPDSCLSDYPKESSAPDRKRTRLLVPTPGMGRRRFSWITDLLTLTLNSSSSPHQTALNFHLNFNSADVDNVFIVFGHVTTPTTQKFVTYGGECGQHILTKFNNITIHKNNDVSQCVPGAPRSANQQQQQCHKQTMQLQQRQIQQQQQAREQFMRKQFEQTNYMLAEIKGLYMARMEQEEAARQIPPAF
ncbi:hypothetical protein COCON_G00033780 [Conger conger]|uniref:Uncharacterized protein n=2 Tax=Conger conger TaxID=82655 RepID=A0A9Q1DZA3_CONCO|nr:hypothetical protein COCON_G00033780 [Conger conger]